jgi:hypothetical protein
VRILEKLIERTDADEIAWERAARPDSYAVTIAGTRFRVGSVQGNGQPPFVLEFLGDVGLPPMRSDDAINPESRQILLPRLYAAARTSTLKHALDLLGHVEEQLGLPPVADHHD